MATTYGSARDPFRGLNIMRVLVTITQITAVSAYAAAFGAFRYHDQVLDPWNTFVFYRFAAQTPMFLFGLMMAWLLWDNYGVRGYQTLQFIVSLGISAVGAVQLVWMIIDWTNCNENTGVNPDVPWCRNRYAPIAPPAGELADFSFYMLFVGQSANLLCAIYWIVFGQSVKSANSALIVRSIVSGDSIIASEYTNKQYASLEEASNDHLKMLGTAVGAALRDAATSETPVMDGVKDGDEHLHRVAGNQIVHALYTAQAKYPNSGGLPSFSRFLGHSLGDNLSTAIDAHKLAVTQASTLHITDHDRLRFGYQV